MSGRKKHYGSMSDAELAAAKAEKQAELEALKTAEKERNTRKKVLYGHAILEEIKALEENKVWELRKILDGIVDKHITRPVDRVFLGLKSLPEKDAKAKEAEVLPKAQGEPSPSPAEQNLGVRPIASKPDQRTSLQPLQRRLPANAPLTGLGLRPPLSAVPPLRQQVSGMEPISEGPSSGGAGDGKDRK